MAVFILDKRYMTLTYSPANQSDGTTFSLLSLDSCRGDLAYGVVVIALLLPLLIDTV